MGAVLMAIGWVGMPLTGVERAAGQVQVAEATIRELQEAMASGQTTSAEIVAAYVARVRAFDSSGPRLNSIIRLNPNALAEATALDRERAESGPRGPLHGVPVLLKDNYDTFDMPTSAGTLALAGLVPPDDAYQVRRLRAAGAVLLGKTNLHELASGITTVSSLGGQTLNPYDASRNPGGSSGGTGAAIAASFAAIGWGSDTCGSIRIPAAHNNLVGLRPTKGLSSIDGIIPLSHTQDVGGPLARTMEDLAIALDATIGADPADPATRALQGRDLPDFVGALNEDALAGARIGLFEPLFGDDPLDAAVAAIVRSAVGRMEALGATVVTVQMPGFADLISGSGVIGHEFKWDLMDYLGTVPGAPVGSLDELIEIGLIHDAVIGTMRRWNEPATRDSDEYQAALASREALRSAMLAEMDRERLDALAYPTIRRTAVPVGDPQPGSACQLSAHTGMPALALPAGWSAGLPVSMELLGRPFEDDRLVALGYSFEQASDLRRPPALTPAMGTSALAPRTLEIELSGSDVTVSVQLVYLADEGRLDYTATVLAGDPQAVLGVVLGHADELGRPSVAARLGGPGGGSSTGEITLSARLRGELAAGTLHVELITRGSSLERVRMPIDFPDIEAGND